MLALPLGAAVTQKVEQFSDQKVGGLIPDSCIQRVEVSLCTNGGAQASAFLIAGPKPR